MANIRPEGDIVLQSAIELLGVKSQLIVAIEELSELQKELCKELRGQDNRGHISEEMADVYIMLRQLDMIFGNEKETDAWVRRKIARL